MLALARFRAGERALGLATARKALALLRRSRPVTYWNQQSSSAVAEVMLAALESAGPDERVGLGREARAAVEAIRGYGRVFPFARPSALLWSGVYHFLRGRRARALRTLHEAIEAAERVGMPYERGRAWLEMGRHLEPGERKQAALLRARQLLTQIEANADVTIVEAELSKARAPEGNQRAFW
jgi:hypothetical protein